MSRICEITGKTAMGGNSVSHSNRKTKRKFSPNLQTKTFFLTEESREITLKVSAAGLRNITKKGLYICVQEAREKGYLKK
ncbi:MAG: 50S ribosomal protein L28 [bacterium]